MGLTHWAVGTHTVFDIFNSIEFGVARMNEYKDENDWMKVRAKLVK